MKHPYISIYRIAFLLMIAFAGCIGNSNSSSFDTSTSKNIDTIRSKKISNSTYSKKAVDSMSRVEAIDPDSIPVLPPSQAEERERLKKTYDLVKTIDSTFISNNDILHFHLKYYCLKNINLVEPKAYDPDTKHPKEFVTHPFVFDIALTHNSEVVLNRLFKASDLNLFFEDTFGGNLKKYGSLLMPKLAKRNKDKSRVVIDCPIAIPATDIGIGMFLIISKNGSYTFVENY